MTRIRDLLREQDGVLRRDQAVACGMSTSAIDRRLADGDWEVVHTRVYRPADRTLDDRGRVRAGALWAGDDATVVGTGAAIWWHMTTGPLTTLRLASGPNGGHTAPQGIVLTRRSVPDRVRIDDVWVSKRTDTALDAGVELGLVDGARLVDRALQEDKVSVDGLRQALDARGPRHGTVLARRLVTLAEGDARFEAERRAQGALHAAGIRDGVPNLAVELPGWGTAVIDLAFRQQRVAVEIDGWAFHRDVERFRRDALRQNELTLAGWRVLRVTWYDLVAESARFVASVRRALLGVEAA
jgi:hypothetical protein